MTSIDKPSASNCTVRFNNRYHFFQSNKAKNLNTILRYSGILMLMSHGICHVICLCSINCLSRFMIYIFMFGTDGPRRITAKLKRIWTLKKREIVIHLNGLKLKNHDNYSRETKINHNIFKDTIPERKQDSSFHFLSKINHHTSISW